MSVTWVAYCAHSFSPHQFLLYPPLFCLPYHLLFFCKTPTLTQPIVFPPTFSRCVCVYKSPYHAFDLPLIKALDWAQMTDNLLTLNIGPQCWLVKFSIPNHYYSLHNTILLLLFSDIASMIGCSNYTSTKLRCYPFYSVLRVARACEVAWWDSHGSLWHRWRGRATVIWWSANYQGMVLYAVKLMLHLCRLRGLGI